MMARKGMAMDSAIRSRIRSLCTAHPKCLHDRSSSLALRSWRSMELGCGHVVYSHF
uniref:Uncharacterized protein n=1 Tax=Arundo donax TaxID=35708 RepID=A0A0A9D2A4_ARUDO